MKTLRTTLWISTGLFGLCALVAVPATADQVINDDLIVDGSVCAGFDCVNGESFGFDTLRLKENNLRIRFFDTSSSASFPTRDWQITINDTSNGGQEKFSIDDIDGGRTPFTIEANAPSHSLYVDDGGRIGLGTSTPVAEVHIKDGDTPTLRLEQDGSSGFTAQTWDVAGNETNYFIRDASNGSKLPFRIRPAAPTSSIDIAANGDVGMGTSSPSRQLHITRSDAAQTRVLVENTNGTAQNTGYQMSNNLNLWNNLVNTNGNWVVSVAGSGVNELEVDASGNLFIRAVCNENSAFGAGTGSCADYVFEPDYPLMPLDEVRAFIALNKHLPNVPSADEIKAKGVNLQSHQGRLLEKVEELFLYTLEQQETIDALTARLQALETPE